MNTDGTDEAEESEDRIAPVLPLLPHQGVSATVATPPSSAAPQHLAPPRTSSEAQHLAPPRTASGVSGPQHFGPGHLAPDAQHLAPGHVAPDAQHLAPPSTGPPAQHFAPPPTTPDAQHLAPSQTGADPTPRPIHEPGPHGAVRAIAHGARRVPRRLSMLVGGGVAAAAIVTLVLIRQDDTAPNQTVLDSTPQVVVPATTPQLVVPETSPQTTPPSTPQDTAVVAGATEWTVPVTGDVVTDQNSAVQSFTGFWDGDWGQIVIQIDADGVATAAYLYDSGFIVGTVHDGLLRGTWCEAPSYSGTTDSGLVEMRIVQNGDVRSIDGRWIYGTDSSAGWSENWDVTGKSTADQPMELLDRLPMAAATCVDVS